VKKFLVLLLVTVACAVPLTISTQAQSADQPQTAVSTVSISVTDATARGWNCDYGWEWFAEFCEKMERAWDCYVHGDCGDDF
jgi:uncharacterized membrane protein